MTLPVEGVTVVDMSRYIPGAYCTMILGDMGADVIRVEQPFRSRQSTSSGAETTPPGEHADAYSGLYRNKKSIGLNLKTDEGKKAFYKLVEKADVVVESSRPLVAKRLGVDYETLSRINPSVIYCSITGYGQDGPYRDMPGHDINYLSMTGVLGILNEGGSGPPIVSGVKLADIGGGSFQATVGILLALLAREKTGKGQYVDIAMADGIMSWLTRPAAMYFETGEAPEPGVVAMDGKRPGFYPYRTKDGGYISFGLREEKLFQNMCRAIGREDLIPDQNAPSPRREEVIAELQQVFLTKNRDEWFEFLREKDISVSPVHTLPEAFNDPHFIHREMVVELDHPEAGKVKQLGIPIKLSDTPGRIARFAPKLGEHNEEILLDLGYSKEDMARMRAAGAIN
ncbi:CaiB/BaiF CoA transferase family protein [Thermodesulfobacteriota bacterium]